MVRHYLPQKMNSANRLISLLVIAVSAVVGLLACSADSLWIDEAWMALLASAKNLPDWWRTLWEMSGSTLHMPLYALYLWLWEKGAGHSEWALRAANIPFFVLGQWALFRSLQHERRLALFVALIAAISPFVWGYLAEARPYVMQYAGGCLVIAGLIQLSRSRSFATRDLALFCAGLVLLCGSSALAFPWAGMAVLAALYLSYKDRTSAWMQPRNILLSAGTGLILLAIFAFDIWALRSGAKASSVGSTSGASLLFVGYELLGFLGLGPGRLDMRESQSLSVITPYLLPLSALALALALAGSHVRRVERRLWTALLLYSVVPVIFVTMLALIAPFRLLGRHLTPLAPVLFVILGYAATAPARWCANWFFIPLWLVSALMLRIEPRHHRDDYRDAAREAKAALAKNELVWWSADSSGAAYYGVPLGGATEGCAVLVVRPSPADLAQLPAPGLVVVSKPDIYDPNGELGSFLREHSFAPVRILPAFKIWRRLGVPDAPGESAKTVR